MRARHGAREEGEEANSRLTSGGRLGEKDSSGLQPAEAVSRTDLPSWTCSRTWDGGQHVNATPYMQTAALSMNPQR